MLESELGHALTTAFVALGSGQQPVQFAKVYDGVDRLEPVRARHRKQLAVRTDQGLEFDGRLFGNHPVQWKRDAHELVPRQRRQLLSINSWNQSDVKIL